MINKIYEMKYYKSALEAVVSKIFSFIDDYTVGIRIKSIK